MCCGDEERPLPGVCVAAVWAGVTTSHRGVGSVLGFPAQQGPWADRAGRGR